DLEVGDVLNVGDPTSFGALLPGDVVSNAPVDASMQLHGAAMIKGDAESAGGIVADSSVTLGGRLRPWSNPVVIPSLPFTPPVTPTDVADLASPATSPELIGFNSTSGPLVVNGDLQLDGAVLQVNGDLTVNGAVQGWGAVYVSGKTTLNGGANLRTEDLTAVLSQGDLTIAGSGQNSSYFTGVIYTEGDFHASDITLIGAFMANKQASGQVGGSAMTMSNVNAILVQSLTNVQFTVTSVPASLLDQPLPPIPGVNHLGMPNTSPGSLVPVNFGDQGLTARMVGVDDHGNIAPSALTDNALGNVATWNGLSGAQSLRTWMAMWPPQMVPPQYPGGYSLAAYNQAAALLQGTNKPAVAAQLRAVIAQVQQQIWNQMNGLIDNKVNGGTIFRLDLSQFFNPYDRLHLVVWRELPAVP
ncbi:MAG: hypothetical protein ACYCW6_21375, partial [Candidatus Xenobia bacterium]